MTGGRLRWLLAAYVALLAVHHLVAFVRAPAAPAPGVTAVTVREFDETRAASRSVHVAYSEWPGSAGRERPAVLLLHGSPGRKEDFRTLAPALAGGWRAIAPDLPGFGSSERRVPDYSIRAHADYAVQLLDELGIERAHVVGFSMGGGVALELWRRAPHKVESIVMLSSIGVQELELTGDYHVNHAVHALQLALVAAADNLVPHFGALDRFPLNVPYARNFFDTDQRPLRSLLASYDGPMLILHGRRDALVPVEAAQEHARIVPQSELETYPAGHFMTFRQGEMLARRIEEFAADVESGRALTRERAPAERLTAATRPFDPRSVPAADGLALAILSLLIAAATFVSEDLTCISAGLLAADGRISYPAAVAACLAGITIGDMLLFLAGRWLGGAALRRRPLRWLVGPERVARSSRWFRQRGLAAIFLSRFMPGARLPTYFAAGAVGTGFWLFSLYFLAAAAVWTPVIVGLSMLAGVEAGELVDSLRRWGVFGLLAGSAVLLVILRVGLPALTRSGRRRLVSAWRRWTRWEFWPPWLFYPPVVVYVLAMGLRFGRPTLFTAANPAIEAGGFIGESKSRILDGLRAAREHVPHYALIPRGTGPDTRAALLRDFEEMSGSSYPVVVKPDAGQRGSGVRVVRNADELESVLDEQSGRNVIVQQYVPGREFGVFYARHPDEPRGRVISITDKRMPAVTGDGRRTVEQLILDDERAAIIAPTYFRESAERLDTVPAPGERVPLVAVGTHARGAVFLDGSELLSDELTSRIDSIARSFDGFHFGRFDVRVPTVEDFRRGQNLAVIELNGVTSESTHIYDPAVSLIEAYRTLFRQWRLAFEIGRANAARGHAVTPLGGLARLLLRYRREARA